MATVGVTVDSDIYNQFVVLPENIRKDLTKWFKASKRAQIFITGKTGAGKSSVVNALVGDKVAEEGYTLDPKTSKVTKYQKKMHCDCVEVTIWDSPGLQDGTSREDEYLADMKKNCSDMDLCVYCANLLETRFTKDCSDIVAMKKLTSAFGKDMWKHAIFILTFANVLEDVDIALLDAEDGQKSVLFEGKIAEWERVLKEALVEDVGVDEAVVKNISVVPAGYTQPNLLDRDYWLSPVWFEALYAMKPMAQPAMMKMNFHRIVRNPEEIRKEDFEKFIHQHPVIFSKRGADIGKKYGESKIGEAIGLAEGQELSVHCEMAINLLQLFSVLESFFSQLQIHMEKEEKENPEDMKG